MVRPTMASCTQGLHVAWGPGLVCWGQTTSLCEARVFIWSSLLEEDHWRKTTRGRSSRRVSRCWGGCVSHTVSWPASELRGGMHSSCVVVTHNSAQHRWHLPPNQLSCGVQFNNKNKKY